MLKKYIVILSLSFISFLWCIPSVGQNGSFSKLYGHGYRADAGFAVIQNSKSEYMMIGNSWDPFTNIVYGTILKTDIDGNLVDTIKVFKDTSFNVYGYYQGDIRFTPDSNLVMVWTFLDKVSQDAWYQIIKMNTDGDPIWTRNHSYAPGWTVARTIINTIDEGFAIAGWYWHSHLSGSPSGLYLAKMDSLGNKEWGKVYGGIRDDEGYSVVQTKDKGFLIIGQTESYGAGKSDMYLVKTDSLGNLIWQKTFGSPYPDWGSYIYPTLDSNYILVGGKSRTSDYTSRQAWIIKINEVGNIIWEREFGGQHRDGFNMVYQLYDSSFVAIGNTRSFKSDGDYAGWIMKISNKGDSLWSRSFTRSPNKDEYFYDFKPTRDGGFIICGMSWPDTNQGPYFSDAWLVKVDSMGCLIPGCDPTGIIILTDNPTTILVYPNPFSSHTTIKIQSSVSGEIQLTLYNILGRTVRQIQNRSHEIVLQRDNLPSGMYFYNVNSEEGLLGNGKVVIR